MFNIPNLVRTLAVSAVLALAATASHAVTFTFDSNGGDGVAVDNGPAGAFDFAVTVVSNNNGDAGIFTTATAVADTSAISVEGQWQYSTNDVDTSSFDPFGYFIDDVFTGLVQLSTDEIVAPAFQSGTFSFTVELGQSFGFYALATDGILGSSTGVALGNISAIPVPAAGLLLLTALGAAAALRRRKTAIAA